jgi:hypothetical protein
MPRDEQSMVNEFAKFNEHNTTTESWEDVKGSLLFKNVPEGLLEAYVSSSKIQAARGKRDTVIGQRAVMGVATKKSILAATL